MLCILSRLSRQEISATLHNSLIAVSPDPLFSEGLASETIRNPLLTSLVFGGCRRLLHALDPPRSAFLFQQFLASCHPSFTSVKIIKNEVGCRDDTVPKTVDTRRHCEED